ncbi:APC amino acid permease [Auricularia subglabra TFB-10046 SS5]|nr:APC amino acid permease [Auricularia subglabra TFB-10046 SS5]
MAPGHDTESVSSSAVDDEDVIAGLYKPSFKREFTNLATISFAFSIMGMCSSIATTFNTPLTVGGPASATWCWILGASMCFTLGASIAEIVSAFPTSGGLYTASAQLCPPKQRAMTGYLIGWLNILGQIAGISSTEFGLSNMIWAAVSVGKGGNIEITQGKVVGLFAGLLVVHGILNSLATRMLARITSAFVFVNVGATVLIIIVLLACTGRENMNSAGYVFGSEGIVNQTEWNTGIAFLFGLLSVQWTMTDYDATAHISEEVKRAAYAAPSAIFIAVLGTGLIGWLLNIVLVLCSPPLDQLPGPSGLAFMEIMHQRIGTAGALVLWVPVVATAFFVVQTALQACSRTIFAFSRDRGLPDRRYFAHVSTLTQTPLRAVALTTFLSILPGLLDLASPTAANAVFALTAMALDLSYIYPIFLRRWYRNHPEVQFTPGPFYMGDGWLGWSANVVCIVWTLFVCVIFALPTVIPVTADNMNYAAPITAGVLILSLFWYVIQARFHYKGPVSDIDSAHNTATPSVVEDVDADADEKAKVATSS